MKRSKTRRELLVFNVTSYNISTVNFNGGEKRGTWIKPYTLHSNTSPRGRVKCANFHGKAKKKYMCVYCHMSKKSRVGRSGLIFFSFFLLLSAKPEIVVPGSGIGFRYFFFEISGKMTNCAVFLPSLLSISTKS